MTQEGFSDFVFAKYDKQTGTATSYITALRIIDEMFLLDDVFGLRGQSVTTITDGVLLKRILDFILEQQKLFRKGKDSIFRNINPRQQSYPRNSFCSAAMRALLAHWNEWSVDQQANALIIAKKTGRAISKTLIDYFHIDKEGEDVDVVARMRRGQGYFRRMVLANYDGKCCVTGLNVPQTLRASHIVAWAEDKANRMNPENGLCLSATYDAAFDQHLISFDDNYRMIISKEIRDYYTNETTREYFEKYEGKKLLLPNRYMPSKTLLEKHRELLIR